jgi:hypothetical protein
MANQSDIQPRSRKEMMRTWVENVKLKVSGLVEIAKEL